MPSGNRESKALLAVRVTTLVPVLWFFLAGAIAKAVGPDWIPAEAYFWPMMLGVVALTAVYAAYRRDVQDAEGIAHVRFLYRFAAGMFIILNGVAFFFYSWIAAIPVVLCLVILLDSLLNKPVKAAS